ncbi:hypothetical protein HDU97_008315, partial [Phlyctochytrium planicorne]
MKYVRQAFFCFANWYRPMEAMHYYEMLKELENTYRQTEKPNLEQAEELRYLALISSKEDAELRYCQAFEKLGLHIKTSSILLILKLLKCSSYISNMLKYDVRERRICALYALSKIFVGTISKTVVREYGAAMRKEKITPDPSTAKFSHLFELLEDIKDLAICAVAFFTQSDTSGLELALCQ